MKTIKPQDSTNLDGHHRPKSVSELDEEITQYSLWKDDYSNGKIKVLEEWKADIIQRDKIDLYEPVIQGLNNYNNANDKQLPYSTLTAMVGWIVKELKKQLSGEK
jgi:hypothetical protein